jgi:hypothetical protein
MNFPALIPFIGSAFTSGFGYEGAVFGITMWLRFFVIFLFVPLLFVTTSLLDMMEGLMQLRLKFDYAFLVATSVRFLPVFLAIQVDIKDAQKIRGTEYDEDVPISKKLTSLISLFIPLAIRAFRFAVDLDIAIRSRAMGAHPTRTKLNEFPLARKDKIIMVLATLGTITAIFLNYYLFFPIFFPWIPFDGLMIMLPEFINIPLRTATVALFNDYINPLLRFIASWIAFPVNFALLSLGLPTFEAGNPYYLYNPSFLFILPANPIELVIYIGLALIVGYYFFLKIAAFFKKRRRRYLRNKVRKAVEKAEQEADERLRASEENTPKVVPVGSTKK